MVYGSKWFYNMVKLIYHSISFKKDTRSGVSITIPECYPKSKKIYICKNMGDHNTVFEAKQQVIIVSGATHLSTSLKQPVKMMRIRGGGINNPNVHENWNQIPALTEQKFSWNGEPCVDFIEKVYYPLKMGLGSLNQNGWTLLATCERRAAGSDGPRAPPLQNALNCSPQIKMENDQRIERSFCCILNYILSTSYFYKLAMRTFDMDGIGVFHYMPVFGQLPRPTRELQLKKMIWNELTMASVYRGTYHAETLIRWALFLCEQGRKLNLDNDAVKEKFLDGMPEFMEAIKVHHKNDNTTVHPANYPGYFPAKLRGTPHPQAGEPDIIAIAKIIYPEWVSKLSLLPNRTPKGFTRLTLQDDKISAANSSVEQIRLAVEDVNKDTVCSACHGIGHAALQKTKDGKKIYCASVTLGYGLRQQNKQSMKPSNALSVATDDSGDDALSEIDDNDDGSSHQSHESDDEHASQASQVDDDASSVELDEDMFRAFAAKFSSKKGSKSLKFRRQPRRSSP
jgi:hypothetical protein